MLTKIAVGGLAAMVLATAGCGQSAPGGNSAGGAQSGQAFLCRWNQVENKSPAALVKAFDLWAAGKGAGLVDQSGNCGPAPTKPMSATARSDAQSAVRAFMDQNLDSLAANGADLNLVQNAGLASPEAVSEWENAANRNPTQSGSATQSATASTTTWATTTAPPAALRGLGAMKAAFDADHTPQQAAANASGVNGVDTVNVANGRVIGFVLEFNAQPPLSIAEAQPEARAELPADAHLVLARRPGSTCAQEFFRSAALNRATGARVALIEYESGQPGDPYDASAVASATFTDLPTVDRGIPC